MLIWYVLPTSHAGRRKPFYQSRQSDSRIDAHDLYFGKVRPFLVAIRVLKVRDIKTVIYKATDE
jgi:hypothetical protein